MEKQLEQLKDFQYLVFTKTGNRYNIEQEFIPDNFTARLRADLIMEEADELNDALSNGTKAEMLKEVCDVLYVTLALAVIYNLPLEAAFDEVHQNNMLKLTNATVAPNGKVVKDKDHPKVDLTSLLILDDVTNKLGPSLKNLADK